MATLLIKIIVKQVDTLKQAARDRLEILGWLQPKHPTITEPSKEHVLRAAPHQTGVLVL